VSETQSIITLLVPADAAGVRLDQWLAGQLPDISRVRVQQLVEQQKVSVNGILPSKTSLKLRGGEQVIVSGEVSLPPLRAYAENIPLDIVYEDQEMAIINKPAGMMVHAGSGKESAGKGTLVNALLHHMQKLSQVGGELRPGIVHRLDKETSGLIVVAKTDKAHRRLAQQFSRREVKKTYITLVHGQMKKSAGTIDTPISRDMVRRTRMTTRRSEGRAAVTHWKVMKEIESVWGKFSLLEVTIETGRTHQIRVHLASLGHPVAGDTLYGAPRVITGSKAAQGTLSLKRNFLHAAAIQLKHPTSDTPLSFKQPLPVELEDFLRQITD
jgi:23S rRNA pseudouridine1911/1915/1917 synthase